MRLPVLNGIRGFAILMVVLLHNWSLIWFSMPQWLSPYVRCGFVGVELFFFLSGFVLTLPYLKAKFENKPLPHWKEFLSRRYLKIFPSYLFCICILQIFHYYSSFHGSGIGPSTLKDVVTHLLFIHNWFNETIGSVSGVMWSLAVEIQFYIIFPFIIVAFLRWPMKFIILMFLIGNLWRLYICFSHQNLFTLEMHELPAFIDVFATGMLSAYVYILISFRKTTIVSTISYSTLMIVGLITFSLLINNLIKTSDPVWPATWQVYFRSLLAIVFAMTSIGAIFAWKPLQFIFNNRLIVFIGFISYNWYLWHEVIANVLIINHVVVNSNIQQASDSQKTLFLFISLIISLTISILLTYNFEQPLMKLKWKRN